MKYKLRTQKQGVISGKGIELPDGYMFLTATVKLEQFSGAFKATYTGTERSEDMVTIYYLEPQIDWAKEVSEAEIVEAPKPRPKRKRKK